MTYRIDLKTPDVLVPHTLIPSVKAPGKSISVNEDGSALGVDPNGTEVSVPADDPGFDSAYTVADVVGGFLIYHSPQPPNPGVVRGYKLVQ